MSVDFKQLRKLLQRYKEIQAKRKKCQREVERVNRLVDARAGTRQTTRQTHSASQVFPEDIGAGGEASPIQESHHSWPSSGQDPIFPVPPPSIAEDPNPTPTAPCEETLRRFATTIAYSSYSRLCGTSDDSLTHHLFEDDLGKDPACIFGPKKMVDIPPGGHNITFLRQELVEGGASPFIASMTEARRRIVPEVTTNDQVRRLGPAEVLDDSLPIYWIVAFSQKGIVDWEGGCSLARAYRRVFEEFGAGDVHCLVFECDSRLEEDDHLTAYAME